ncbi:hypothetical protein C8F04DRAFT_1181683 [Mycena alexandri]|uniref:Uncharacterized protein n=1 Tax=Mycena alexandri TaxID=1745969 RepID=A0AAD6T1I8_9AGAR|nr:hypothetical protein C8F04DRAFT_1181683 [Mycena alexandri]
MVVQTLHRRRSSPNEPSYIVGTSDQPFCVPRLPLPRIASPDYEPCTVLVAIFAPNRVLADTLKPAPLACIESLHMFPSVFGLTLCIMNLARRAYLPQVPLGTYNGKGDINANKASNDSFHRVQPGTYSILNLGTSTLLRGYREDEPIFVTYTREDPELFARGCPAKFSQWTIESTRSEAFRIFNVGLGQPACVAREVSDLGLSDLSVLKTLQAEVVSCDHHPAEFFITHVAEGAYMIGTEDKVWTVDSFPMLSKASLTLD